jgi:hypothetical protein
MFLRNFIYNGGVIMKKRNALIIALTSILLISSFNFTANAQDDSKVSIKEIKQAVAFQIKLEQKTEKKSLWGDGKIHIEDPIPVYDALNTISSYIVNLTKNSDLCGFIEISASRDEFPILSYSMKSSAMNNTKIKELGTKKKILSKTEKSTKVVKLSAGYFGIKKDYMDNSSEVIAHDDNMCYQMNSDKKIAEKKSIEFNKNSRELWNKIDNVQITGDIGTSSDGVTDILNFETGTKSSYYIPNVPDYNQKSYPKTGSYIWNGASGCAPTSASNVVYYKGITNSTWDKTIKELRDCMGTKMDSDGQGVTYIDQISSGLKKYFSNHGKSAYVYNYVSPTWSTLKNALLYNNPSIVTFVNQSYYSPNNNGHTVTCVGTVEYSYNGSSGGHQYMVIHDNWGSTPADVYVAYGRNYNKLYVVKVAV